MFFTLLFLYRKLANFFQQDSVNKDITKHFEIIYNNQKLYEKEIIKLKKEIKVITKDKEVDSNAKYDLRCPTGL